jgi:hypothetical protein
LAIFAELRTKNVAEQFGEPLVWQKEIRQDKPLEANWVFDVWLAIISHNLRRLK